MIANTTPPAAADVTLDALAETVARLAAEVETMRAAGQPASGSLGKEQTDVIPPTAPHGRFNRRLMLGRVAAAMAGVGVTGAWLAKPAAAQTQPPKAPTAAGNNIVIGGSANRTSAFNNPTMLRSDQAAAPTNPAVFIVSQDTDDNVGLNVLSSIATAQGNAKSAFVGLHLNGPTAGVPAYGVLGASPGSVGLVGYGQWPLKLVSTIGATPPATDQANNPVEDGVASYLVDNGGNNGSLWFSLKNSIGQPLFRRVATVDQLGVFVGLSTPVRVLDTRPVSTVGYDSNNTAITAGQVASGATQGYRIGGKTFQAQVPDAPTRSTAGRTFITQNVAIPADIRGIAGNVTLVQDPNLGLGGYVTVSAVGVQNIASLNAVGPITGNYFVSGVNFGNIRVYNVGVPRHIIIDLYGYYL